MFVLRESSWISFTKRVLGVLGVRALAGVCGIGKVERTVGMFVCWGLF